MKSNHSLELTLKDHLVSPSQQLSDPQYSRTWFPESRLTLKLSLVELPLSQISDSS